MTIQNKKETQMKKFKWHGKDYTGLWVWFIRRLPRKVLYHCVIQAWADATVKWPSKTPNEITWRDVCDMLDKRS